MLRYEINYSLFRIKHYLIDVSYVKLYGARKHRQITSLTTHRSHKTILELNREGKQTTLLWCGAGGEQVPRTNGAV